MRREIQVRGVVMDNGDIVNEGETKVVGVYVKPDKTAYYTDNNGKKYPILGNVVTYTSRFL